MCLICLCVERDAVNDLKLSHTHTHTHTHTQVVLFDLGSAYWRLEGWRKELWELSHIGIPDDDKECRDAIIFGYLTYWFLSEVLTCSCLCDVDMSHVATLYMYVQLMSLFLVSGFSSTIMMAALACPTLDACVCGVHV